jgi:hypothetical protein
MEVAATGGAPAAATAAPSTSEHTASAQASMPPQVNVSHGGNPGTTAAKPAEGSGKWTDSFDTDTKDFVTQRGFQDPKAVIESYRNLEKLRGVPQDRLLKLPEAPDAPEWNDVYSKLGKPASPEGYGLKPKDPNASGFTDWAKTAFHKLNLTTAQGQELVNQFNEYNSAQDAESRAKHETAVQDQTMKLKKEWGSAFQQNIGRAKEAYRQLGIPDAAIDSLEKSIGFDGVIKLFHDLGTKVGEASFISGDVGSSYGEGSILTPDQANARIRALKQDGDFVQRYLKNEVKAKEQMARLIKMANPAD